MELAPLSYRGTSLHMATLAAAFHLFPSKSCGEKGLLPAQHRVQCSLL